MSRKAEEHLERSPAGWTAPKEPAPKSVWHAFLPLLIGGSLAAGAWHASGAYFTQKARQQAADRWDQVRVCLLGDALLPGDQPSERVRLIELAKSPSVVATSPSAANKNPSDHGPSQDNDVDEAWPQRCLPFAKALDEALAARAIVSQLGPMPSAVAIVHGTGDDAHRADLDLLFAELEMADLPLPKHGTVVSVAPAPAKVVFAGKDLAQLGKVLELNDIGASLDPTTGRVLRLLLPESRPQTCHFNAGAPDTRWKSVVCRASPLTVDREAKLSLAPTDQGGTDLIVVRDAADNDGIYDAATGLMVLKPRYFDTQTHVAQDGRATILYAKMRGDSSLEKVEHFRLMQSQPGKRPASRRLKVPTSARLLLLPEHLLWWVPGDKKSGDTLVAQALANKGRTRAPGPRRTLATLPYGSRFLSRCSDGSTTALLFAAGLKQRRYTLVFDGPTDFLPAHDVGTIEGRVTMSCHDGKAMLLRIQHQRVSRWQCTAETCKLGLSNRLAMLEEKVHAVAPIGERVAVVWKDRHGALRLRVAAPDALGTTPDTVLIDDWQNGGVEMSNLDIVSGGGLGVLLAQDVGRRIYAIRLDARGNAETVRISR